MPLHSDARFAHVHVRARRREVWVDGNCLPLGDRAFDILATLLTAKDQTASKEELMEAVWAGQAVSDGNLHVQISLLRRWLGADTILTVRGRGYRLVPPVQHATAAAKPRSASLPQAAELPNLIGRGAEIALSRQWLAESGAVVICGPGGVGKTRLAREMYQTWQDAAGDGGGRTWIDLAGADSPEAAIATIVAALGLVDIDAGVAEEVLEVLGAQLARVRGLVVLDNVEQIQAATESLIRAVLKAKPTASVRLLTTSRHRLGVPGLAHVPLAGLQTEVDKSSDHGKSHGESPALALFASWANRFGLEIDVAVETEAEQATAICRALDGLPLGLKIAASKVPVLGLSGVRDAVQQAPLSAWRLASSGRASHVDLEALFEWSDRLLEPTERSLLARLAVWSGSFSLENAVAASDADRWQTMNLIDELQRKSLIEHEQMLRETAPRWRLLQTTRRHFRKILAGTGRLDETLERHASACAADAGLLNRAWLAGVQPEAAIYLQAEYSVNDWCAALEWLNAKAVASQHFASTFLRLFGSSARMLWLRGLRSRLDPLAGFVQHLLIHPPPEASSEDLGVAWLAALRLRWGVIGGIDRPRQASRARELLLHAAPALRFEAAYLQGLIAGQQHDAQTALLALDEAQSCWDGDLVPARPRAHLLELQHRLHHLYGVGRPPTDAAIDEALADLEGLSDGHCRAALLLHIGRGEQCLVDERFHAARQHLEYVTHAVQASSNWAWRRLVAPFDTLAVAQWRCGDHDGALVNLHLGLEASCRVNALAPGAASLAYILAWSGRYRAAVQMIAATSAFIEQLGHAVDRVTLHVLAQARAKVASMHGSEEFARWQKEGRSLGESGLRAVLSGKDPRFAP